MKVRAGDWVEVRSREEILATLDKRGRLDELPFMPQMFSYCGHRFKVYKRAHKTCDTVNATGGRRLSDCVHLELRCDGQAYGGCQAACLIFWKTAWLRPVGRSASSEGNVTSPLATPAPSDSRCSEQDVWNARCSGDAATPAELRYFCQATELPFYTTSLPWWDVRQYFEDYTSGNTSLGKLARGFSYLGYYHLTQAWRNKIGRPARWLYDRVQRIWGGVPFPRKRGTLADAKLAPTSHLNLRPGDLVRIKRHEEILATITPGGMNRGLLFDAELVPYCGGVYPVKACVSKFIDEKTGRMTSLKTPALILDNVWCEARYSNCKMFCPRSIYSWWREVWLERAEDVVKDASLAQARVAEREYVVSNSAKRIARYAGRVRDAQETSK